MLEETIGKLESAIKKVSAGKTKERTELLRLLDALKVEVKTLSRTHGEHARSIAGLTDLAAHEATRETKSPALLKHALDGLDLAVKDVEAANPGLVQTVNEICTMLARIGI